MLFNKTLLENMKPNKIFLIIFQLKINRLKLTQLLKTI